MSIAFPTPDAPFGKTPLVELHTMGPSLPAVETNVLTPWLQEVAKHHGYRLTSLAYIFCSDDQLHEMNVEHLDHDTLTDIITFDLRDDLTAQTVEGECYISVDRVRANATGFGVSPQAELHRVMVHGLLHLCGLHDKTDSDRERMRTSEDEALSLLL